MILTGQERHGKLLETQALLQEEAPSAPSWRRRKRQTEAQRAEGHRRSRPFAGATEAFFTQQAAEEKP